MLKDVLSQPDCLPALKDKNMGFQYQIVVCEERACQKEIQRLEVTLAEPPQRHTVAESSPGCLLRIPNQVSILFIPSLLHSQWGMWDLQEIESTPVDAVKISLIVRMGR